jgi:hypothetical protein
VGNPAILEPVAATAWHGGFEVPEVAQTVRKIDGISLRMFTLRVFWAALRLVMVLYLGQRGVRFFYQGF